MSENVIGEAWIRLRASAAGLEKDLDKATSPLRSKLDGLAAKYGDLGKKIGLGLAAGLAAGTTAMVLLTRKSMDSIDAQAKLADRLGASIDGLRGLQIAADDAGIASGALNDAVAQMNVRLGEAAQKTGTAYKALQRLGLDADELISMDVDDRMAAIADRIHELGLSAQDAAYIMRELGIRNREMSSLILQGGDAIRAARQEVDDYGLSLSRVDAAKVEASNDALGRMSRITEGIGNRMAVTFSPMLQELADRFNDLVKANDGFGEVAQKVAEKVIRIFGKVLDVILYFRVGLKTLHLAWVSFAVGVNEIGGQMLHAVTGIFDAINKRANALIETLNRLPGINIPLASMLSESAFVQGFDQAADAVKAKWNELYDELQEMRTRNLPSASFERFIEAANSRLPEVKNKIRELTDETDAVADATQRATGEVRTFREEYQQIADMPTFAEMLGIDEMRDKVKYGFANAEEFIPVLQRWQAQLEQFPREWKLVTDALNEFTTQAGYARDMTIDLGDTMEEQLSQRIQDIPGDLSTAFSRAIVYGQDLGDVMRNLAAEIAAAALQALFFKSIFGGLGGALGGGGGTSFSGSSFASGFLGNLFHSGGIVGKEGTPFSLPRYHRGNVIAADEHVAVLKKGEGVFTQGQMAAMGSGEEIHVTMNINAVDAQSFVQLARTNKGVFESLVLENLMRDGAIRKAIRGVA